MKAFEVHPMLSCGTMSQREFQITSRGAVLFAVGSPQSASAAQYPSGTSAGSKSLGRLLPTAWLYHRILIVTHHESESKANDFSDPLCDLPVD